MILVLLFFKYNFYHVNKRSIIFVIIYYSYLFSMDEDLYLQRLKGIREKYGCSNLFPSEPKGSFILPKNVYPNPEMAYTPSRQEITPSRLKVQHF